MTLRKLPLVDQYSDPPVHLQPISKVLPPIPTSPLPLLPIGPARTVCYGTGSKRGALPSLFLALE